MDGARGVGIFARPSDDGLVALAGLIAPLGHHRNSEPGTAFVRCELHRD